MEIFFDALFIQRDTIFAIGWAVGKTLENTIDIQVYGKGGRKIPCKLTRTIRPDVGLTKFQNTNANNAGIFLEIPYPKNELLCLCLTEISAVSQKPVKTRHILLSRRLIQLRDLYNENKENIHKPQRALREWKRKLLHKEKREYASWLYIMRSQPKELARQRTRTFPCQPLISILLPVSNGSPQPLMETIHSVLLQTYPNWELCIFNCSPKAADFTAVLTGWASRDPRIHLRTAPAPVDLVLGLNAALHMAKGSFTAILKQNDILEADALYFYVSRLNEKPDTDIFYCDEDRFSNQLVRFFQPHFKSDFNRDLLYCYNYMRHFLMVRRSLVSELGGWQAALPGSWEYDFILHCIEHTSRIEHISRILYHVKSSNADRLSFDSDAEVAALNAHYHRCGLHASAARTGTSGCYVSTYHLVEQPLVSVLIPNKDHTDDLDTCLRSLLEHCTYLRMEVIIIENNSTEAATFAYYKEIEQRYPQVQVVTWESGGVFNYSAINNYGFTFSHGEYILLLNNDVEVITPNLIESLLGYCMRPEVGIVGARLLYDDNTVQHAGVLVGAGGIADHAFKGSRDDEPGYMRRSLCTQDMSAVTAACLMVKRSVYKEVGGLDETFQVAFNDVDFCLKVRKAGYLIVYNAEAKLHHYESKSRGIENTSEKSKRFENETLHMNEKWDILGSFADPYYNPNLSLAHLEYYKLNYARRKERLEELGPAYKNRILRNLIILHLKAKDRWHKRL